ncbi:GTP-binding protein [Candidatus Gottesmanbacteria bacterium]|nr:GTP-binding protein [Candidatus Gottesmanbacteria bacterium]
MKPKKVAKNQQINQSSRPPIVAVLGHVDHGKTTLLDFIRKSNVAAREHGGITQHIGAYQIETKNRAITFIDTPGHEAFAQMRSRGAKLADIAILVVAADDSVKPQTKESIEQINRAGIPMIIAVNKIDLPAANIDRVKQDLAKNGVQVEGFGGDVPIVPVSAKVGTGISELLDMILLVSDMKGIPSQPHANLEAVVIETRVDPGKGMVATLIVKTGTLRVGMPLYEGTKQIAKVRACFDEYGKRVVEALPSRPVETLGFTVLPTVGTIIFNAPGSLVTAPPKKKVDQMPDFLKPIEEEQKLKVIIKADTAGSLEAVRNSLPEQVTLVGTGIGDINDADVLLAKSSGSIIIGFNVSAKPPVAKLAQTEKVIFRTYKLIYEFINEIGDVVSGLKEVIAPERELGAGQIIAEFPFEKTRIAGTRVSSGRLAKGDTVKIMRGEAEVGRAKIKSLRHGKDDITRAEVGIECGVLLDQKLDFQLGDAIIAFTIG